MPNDLLQHEPRLEHRRARVRQRGILRIATLNDELGPYLPNEAKVGRTWSDAHLIAFLPGALVRLRVILYRWVVARNLLETCSKRIHMF